MRTRLLLVASAMGAGALLLACTPPTGGGGSTTTTTTSSTTTTVVAGTPPTAVIGASATSGTAHLPVDFTGSGSTDDGTIVAYAWNFGDGDTSTAADPHHVFTEAGTYNVTLTVTDNSAQTDSDSVTITVTNDPNGRYVATTGSDTGDCSDSTAPCLTVQYATNQADASGDTVYVDAGAYPEVVYVAKDVTFKGINQGLEGDGGRGAESIVKGIRTGTVAQTPGNVQRSITIDGFRIDPQGDAALISATYKPLVWLIGGASTVVENNVFVGGATYDPDCNSACTTMTDVGLEVRSGAVSIADNSFTIFRRAAWLYQTAPAGTTFTSASVTDNTFTRFTSIGLRIAPSGGNPVLPGVTVDGNEFDNTNGGIGTSSPGGVVVTGGANTFTDNRFDAVASGIYLYVCSAYPVGAQTISGNDFTNAGAGVNVLAENPACTTGDITGTTITQNDFNSNVFFGVVGSYFSAGQPNIAATCNWWDTPSGPNTTGAQAPTTGITTSPWLVDTTDNGGACTGV